MSIENEINRLSGNIAAAYTAVEELGGEMPAQQTSANLAAAVRSIPVSYGSNQNILDNWYFAVLTALINQKGQTEYTGNGYTIDRWQLAQNAGNSIVVEDGYILLRLKSMGVWAQLLENTPEKGIYTFSFLEKDEGLFSVTFNWPTSGHMEKSVYVGGEKITIYVTPPKSIMFYKGSNSIDLKLVAAKLELGSEQTLAHQDADGNWVLNDPPPNKALELLKCQRYFQVFSNEAFRPTNAVDFRPVMRINPTLGTINIDGVTHYTADANL